MTNNEADILQIQKYLAGELTARAMHELERRAQSDPFLAEALEGYETAGHKQGKNLSDLSARLAQRIAPKKGRVVPLWMISVAASVLVVCSAGIWWLSRKPTAVNETLRTANAPVEKKALPADSVKTNSVAANQQKPLPAMAKISLQHEKEKSYTAERARVSEETVSSSVLADVTVKQYKNAEPGLIKDSVQKDTTPVNEMIVMGYTSSKKDTSALLKKSNILAYKAKPVPPTDQLLQGQAAGVTDNNDVAPGQSHNYTFGNNITAQKSLKEISIANNLENKSNMIGGRVITRNGGPLSDATVNVAGTTNSTRTDANGYFDLRVDTGKSTLVVNHSGYQLSQFNANNGDLANTITLKRNDILKNVVITSNNKALSNGTDATVVYAHPNLGWANFNEYVKKSAVSPDGKTGEVKLSFKVAPDGTITDFKVLQGLSPKTNQKAIDMVTGGPSWVGNNNGETKAVTLTIKFGK